MEIVVDGRVRAELKQGFDCTASSRSFGEIERAD